MGYKKKKLKNYFTRWLDLRGCVQNKDHKQTTIDSTFNFFYFENFQYQIWLLSTLLAVVLFKLVSLAQHGVDVKAAIDGAEVNLSKEIKIITFDRTSVRSSG